jgi:SepF-like predicted cell division protein (DUF552 family)
MGIGQENPIKIGHEMKKYNEMSEAKSKFSVGDIVMLTLKGLQQFNRKRSETKSANEFSRMLGDLYDKKIKGKVEKVFPSGSMNVRFGKTVFDIKPFMVEKA